MTEKICCFKHCNQTATHRRNPEHNKIIDYYCPTHAVIMNIQWGNFGKTTPYAIPIGDKDG